LGTSIPKPHEQIGSCQCPFDSDVRTIACRTGRRTSESGHWCDAVKSLAIRNLSKTYFDLYAGTQVAAVRDVSLEVPAGEFVSMVGPSGCGKSTILNMIAGFIPITGGEILVGGQPVKGPGRDRGVVFQSFALFPWRTVLDNVAFGPKMRGIGKAEREEIAHEYLALAKLTEAAGRY